MGGWMYFLFVGGCIHASLFHCLRVSLYYKRLYGWLDGVIVGWTFVHIYTCMKSCPYGWTLVLSVSVDVC